MRYFLWASGIVVVSSILVLSTSRVPAPICEAATTFTLLNSIGVTRGAGYRYSALTMACMGTGLALLIIGCSPAPYSQRVSGNLLESGVPVGGVPVRFALSSSGQSQPCAPVVAETITDQQGQFSLSTQYVPRFLEYFVVLIQHDAVCMQLNHEWITAWELTTGPAKHTISLQCVLNQGSKVLCEG